VPARLIPGSEDGSKHSCKVATLRLWPITQNIIELRDRLDPVKILVKVQLENLTRFGLEVIALQPRPYPSRLFIITDLARGRLAQRSPGALSLLLGTLSSSAIQSALLEAEPFALAR
jgi:hypothetical protein